MRVLFDDIELDIPEIKETNKILKSTPQIKYIKSHHQDLSYKLGIIKYIFENMKNVKSYCEPLAGCGFTAKLAQKYFKLNNIMLNDNDEYCNKVLTDNFKTPIEIHFNDVREFNLVDRYDLIFLDFNTFTIKNFEYWKHIILESMNKTNNLLFTDTFIYGFKFGMKNLKSYDITDWDSYYHKLNDLLKKYNFSIKDLYHLKNKSFSIILATNEKNKIIYENKVIDEVRINICKNKSLNKYFV